MKRNSWPAALFGDTPQRFPKLPSVMNRLGHFLEGSADVGTSIVISGQHVQVVAEEISMPSRGKDIPFPRATSNGRQSGDELLSSPEFTPGTAVFAFFVIEHVAARGDDGGGNGR